MNQELTLSCTTVPCRSFVTMRKLFLLRRSGLLLLLALGTPRQSSCQFRSRHFSTWSAHMHSATGMAGKQVVSMQCSNGRAVFAPRRCLLHAGNMQGQSSTHTGSSENRTRSLVGKSYLISTLPVRANDTPDWVQQQLQKKVEFSPTFFAHVPVLIELRDHVIAATEVQQYMNLLRQLNFVPVGISCDSDEMKEIAQQHGIPVLVQAGGGTGSGAKRINRSEDDRRRSSSSSESRRTSQSRSTGGRSESGAVLPTAATIIKQPIRSGQQVYASGGDLIVFGSVSSGAELLADGSIHVFGKLMGRALAGINGNDAAVITAQHFEAELVSINDVYMLLETVPDHIRQGSSTIVTRTADTLELYCHNQQS